MGSPNVIHVSPEIAPLIQTGGLGDMVGSLGPALARKGAGVAFILPKYGTIPNNIEDIAGIPAFPINLPGLFDRKGIYGEAGLDYPDNALRFATFCRSALTTIRDRRIPCDILHLHDWQTALVPLFLKTLFAEEPLFRDIRTILTIHNLGYQGIFPAADFAATGLPEDLFTPQGLEFYGKINFLKGGIVSADAVTTVSPSYAREVLTVEQGMGFDGILRMREADFSGILNGVDTNLWDPAADPDIAVPFSANRMEGKKRCKAALQRELGLPVRHDIPLIGLVSRLTEQKGIDLAIESIPLLPTGGAQWVILGTGDPILEKRLLQLSHKAPERIAVRIGFLPELAHRIEAGADFFLMPSRYEPCGYSQMYSQRYGTIPIVRATGGLKDTVIDLETDTQQGTGFFFQEPDAEAIAEAVRKALDLFQNQPLFDKVRQRGMQRDFSWDNSAEAYLHLYRAVLARPGYSIEGSS